MADPRGEYYPQNAFLQNLRNWSPKKMKSLVDLIRYSSVPDQSWTSFTLIKKSQILQQRMIDIIFCFLRTALRYSTSSIEMLAAYDDEIQVPHINHNPQQTCLDYFPLSNYSKIIVFYAQGLRTALTKGHYKCVTHRQRNKDGGWYKYLPFSAGTTNTIRP